MERVGGVTFGAGRRRYFWSELQAGGVTFGASCKQEAFLLKQAANMWPKKIPFHSEQPRAAKRLDTCGISRTIQLSITKLRSGYTREN